MAPDTHEFLIISCYIPHRPKWNNQTAGKQRSQCRQRRVPHTDRNQKWCNQPKKDQKGQSTRSLLAAVLVQWMFESNRGGCATVTNGYSVSYHFHARKTPAGNCVKGPTSGVWDIRAWWMRSIWQPHDPGRWSASLLAYHVSMSTPHARVYSTLSQIHITSSNSSAWALPRNSAYMKRRISIPSVKETAVAMKPRINKSASCVSGLVDQCWSLAVIRFARHATITPEMMRNTSDLFNHDFL